MNVINDFTVKNVLKAYEINKRKLVNYPRQNLKVTVFSFQKHVFSLRDNLHDDVELKFEMFRKALKKFEFSKNLHDKL